MLARARHRNRLYVEIDLVTAAQTQHSSVDENYCESENMTASVAVEEAAGATSVGGDSASDESGILRGVGGIELPGWDSSPLKIAQDHAGAGNGEALVNLNSSELLDRNHPATEGDAAAGDASPASSDGNWDYFF